MAGLTIYVFVVIFSFALGCLICFIYWERKYHHDMEMMNYLLETKIRTDNHEKQYYQDMGKLYSLIDNEDKEYVIYTE